MVDTKKVHDSHIEKLVETNIAIDKKTVELIDSISQLVKKIDSLVNIFDEASKHVLEVGEDKKILNLTDKVESLIEQNKTIAKGLLMLEQYVKSKTQYDRPSI